MNWDDIRVFATLARSGTLSATARALKLSQPTVGRRIDRLEHDMGARLFDRLAGGYALTAAGERLLPLADGMTRAAEAVDRSSAALADRVSGTVRISVNETLADFIVTALPGLRARLADVEFEFFVTHSAVNLSKREADILIRDCLPDASSLVARKLGRMTYGIYGAHDYVAANPEARTRRRFAECDWVGFDEDHTRFAGYAWLRDKLGNRSPVHRTNNGMVLRHVVRAGGGLGILPCFAGDGDASLERLGKPLEEVSEQLWLLVHPDLKRRPAVRAVMDELIAVFHERCGELSGAAA